MFDVIGKLFFGVLRGYIILLGFYDFCLVIYGRIFRNIVIGVLNKIVFCYFWEFDIKYCWVIMVLDFFVLGGFVSIKLLEINILILLLLW